jgi:BatD DUF11 like domain
MKHFYFLVFLIFFLPTLVVGSTGGNPTFEATCDARQVVLGAYFEVSFTLHNTTGDAFAAPSFGEFKVLSGPNTSVSQTIINGQRTSTYTYSYTLQGKKIGMFSIGSASIRANGQTLQTQPLSVEVVKGQSNVPNGKGSHNVFVRAETSTREAHLGGQVTLDYKLYTLVNIESVSVLSEPSYTGFFQEEIKNWSSPTSKEVVNGEQYLTKILKRIVLYPQQTGRLEIEGMTFNITIPSDNSRSNPMGGFFSFQDVREVPIHIEPFAINVLPLPSPAPPLFSGGVGVYSISSSINRTDASTDDALTLHLTVTGEGDIKRLQAPKLDLGNNFEVYEPKIVEEVTTENNGRLVGRKEIDYLLLPKQAGSFSVSPSLTYFNTDKKQYSTETLNPYTLTIRQGKGKPDTGAKLPDNTLTTNSNSFFLSSLKKTLLGGCLVFCLLGMGLFFYKKQKNKSTLHPSEVTELPLNNSVADASPLEKEATKDVEAKTSNWIATETFIAQKPSFSQARLFLKQENSTAFYHEIIKIIHTAAAEKYQLSAADLNEENIIAAMQRWNSPMEQIHTVQYLLHTCNLALYAQKDSSHIMETVLEQAETIHLNQ